MHTHTCITTLGLMLLTMTTPALAAIPHGSIKGSNVSLYDQGLVGGKTINDDLTPANPKLSTLHYKMVTVNGKTWALTHYEGTPDLDMGADWTSQLRYWTSTGQKTENNLIHFKDADSKTIIGKATSAIPEPVQFSFFQAINAPDGFAESPATDYDPSRPNSADNNDTQAPIIDQCNIDATTTSAQLTMSGNDDSDDLFYLISDAEHQIEEVALTNQYTLSGLKGSTIYHLTITPIDYSGNEGSPLAVSFKTGNQRSQITNGANMDYNNPILPQELGGELVATFQRNNNTLTIGCTTLSDLLGGNNGRTFHSSETALKPTVTINGIIYELTSEPGITATTATVTLTDVVGESPIDNGLSLNIQWSIFWSSNDGNFFTASFTYIIGDEGQPDMQAPDMPLLSLNNSMLTWNATPDDLSGTKHYEVTVDGSDALLIPDLGESSFMFPYTPNTTVKVKSVDFAGNSSDAAEYKGNSTAVTLMASSAINVAVQNKQVIINNATPLRLELRTLSGQLLISSENTNAIPIPAAKQKVLLLNVVNADGTQQCQKIIIQ
ncbi:MAG: hypothetical protein JXR39_00620 [Marinilabiliaceae bacterium]|nr:hypothetical protein [Marinilabiliaceae bacterium]